MVKESNMSYAHPLTIKDIIVDESEKKRIDLMYAKLDEQEQERIKSLYDQARLAQKPRANEQQVGGAHYTDKAIQPWDYIIANNLGYLEGNVVKYVSRWKDKGGVEDLKKAQHYLAKLLELYDR
jgi:hypothetical protein